MRICGLCFGATAAQSQLLSCLAWWIRLLAHVGDQCYNALRARRPSCAFLLSIRITFSFEQTFPCELKGLWNQPEGPSKPRQWGRVVSYTRFAKGLEVALYGGDTRGSVSSVRGCYWVSPLWLILLFMTLGKNCTSPPSHPSPLQVPRKNKTPQNNLQLRWVLHTVPFSLHSLASLSQSLQITPPPTLCLCPQPTSLGVELALSPRSLPWHIGRVGPWWTDILGGKKWKGGGMYVLGKQGFVGCDCLIPGGLSFHSSSRLIPHHRVVVRAAASLGSGTQLPPPSPCTSRTACAMSSSRDVQRQTAASEKQAVPVDAASHLSSAVSLTLNDLWRRLALTFCRTSGSGKGSHFVLWIH